MELHGLEVQRGATAFAFLVFRLARPVDRAALVALIEHVAMIVPDAEAFVDELPEDLDEPMLLVGMPWLPPESRDELAAQRRLIERAASHGVEAVWCFQTGTSLPEVEEDDDADGYEDDDADADDDADEDDDEDEGEDPDENADADRAASWDDDILAALDSISEVTSPPLEASSDVPVERAPVRTTAAVADEEAEDDDVDDDDDDDDGDGDDDGDADDDDATWSHGPPPQTARVRFPVDGYPAILERLDWEDFGIAFKLGGPYLAGEGTVLLGFHALWLAPYGGRYRNAAVTIDRTHHAAHLWVDRFAVPCSAAEQVHHLLWVLSKLDEVTPVVHARFTGASMAQKYGSLMGETREPFVLGGNPLLAVHARDGEAGVDAWLASQHVWANEEVAQMLRELAIAIVGERGASAVAEDDEVARRSPALAAGLAAAGSDDDAGDDDEVARRSSALEAGFAAAGSDDADDGDADGGDADDGDGDDGEDGADAGGAERDRGRHITAYAGELLKERARAGLLDPRVADALRPLLAVPAKYEHRRRAVVDILGALRDRASVPAMIQILEDTPIRDTLDAIGKQELVVQTAAALGEISDPTAIPALAKLVAAPGDHHDEPRPVAAEALASCLAAASAPRDVDDAVLGALLRAIGDRRTAAVHTELHFAYGRIARVLPPSRRDQARARLVDTPSLVDDDLAVLAREVALVLAGGAPPEPATATRLRARVHQGLTRLAYDHEATVRDLRGALRIAEALPEVVEPGDLVWLTRFVEPDVRRRAHALLAQLGQPMPEAPRFDRTSARALAADELIARLRDPHVIGRAALIAEAARRDLVAARPAIIRAANDVIDRAREGGANLLDPDTEVLEAAVAALRDNLDHVTIRLFDRMLRHSNHHVKWELLQEPPRDERLLAGMFQVLAEKWGWQEQTAKAWLAQFAGSAAYEDARRRAAPPLPVPEDDVDELDDHLVDDDDDDEAIN